MKSVVKILLYEPRPYSKNGKQTYIKDPLLEVGLVPVSADTVWIGTSGWTSTVGSGIAEYTGATVHGLLTQPFQNELDENLYYDVSFELSGVTAGSIDVLMGQESLGSYSADGVYNEYWTNTGTTKAGAITFIPTNDFRGSVDVSKTRISQYDNYSKLGKLIRYYPSGYLDTKEDFTIAYNFQISFVTDLNQSRGGFTKTFTIPASKQNRDMFRMYGEGNSTFAGLDVRNKMRVDILVDGNTFLQGWMNAKEVEVDQGQFEYVCEYYDSVFGLFDAIRGKRMGDIDVSPYDHLMTDKAIYQTWDPNRSWQSVYTYPLMYLDGTDNLYTTQDFSPSFYNKYLFSRCILDTGAYGFTLSPEADETMSRMITTPAGKRRTIDSATDSQAINVGTSVDRTFNLPSTSEYNTNFLKQSFSDIQMDDESSAGRFDLFNKWDNVLYTYQLEQAGVAHTFEYRLDATITSTPSSSNIAFQLNTGTGGDPNNLDPNASRIVVYVEDPTGARVAGSDNIYNLPQPTTPFVPASSVVNYVFSSSTTLSNPLPGTYKLRVEMTDTLAWLVIPQLIPNVNFGRSVQFESTTAYLAITPALGGPVGDNTMVRLNKWLPNVDQVGFINENMNMLNLYAFTDVRGRINFITRTELYQDPHIIDWSHHKVEQIYTLSPLTDITSTRTVLGYKDASDPFNQRYKDDNLGVLYGDFIFNNNTDLFNEDEEKRLKFYEPTPMVEDQGGRIVPAIYSRDLPNSHRVLLQGDSLYSADTLWLDYYDPYATPVVFDDSDSWPADFGYDYPLLVLVFDTFPHDFVEGDKIRVSQEIISGYNPSYNGLATVLYAQSTFVVLDKPYGTSTSTAYPGSAVKLSNAPTYRPDLHINSITASTIDINFGPIERSLLPFGISITPNNLGQKYYRQQLVQQRDGELYTFSVNLSLLDVHELLDHVGSKIYIKQMNAYFTLYALLDYDAVSTEMTKVQLLKVVSDSDFAFKVPTGGNYQVGVGVEPTAEVGEVGGVLNPIIGGEGGSNVILQYGNVLRGGSTIAAGTGNQTMPETKSVFILGDRNTVDNNVKNAVVMGENVHATEPNTMYLGQWGVFGPTQTKLYDKTMFNPSGMSVGSVSIMNSGVTIGAQSGISMNYSSITIGSMTITSSGITSSSGGTLLPAGIDGQMLYNSGGTWTKRDMGIRVSDGGPNVWMKLGHSTNTIDTGSTLAAAGILLGTGNYLSGNGVIIGGKSNIFTGQTPGLTSHSGMFAGSNNYLYNNQASVMMGGAFNVMSGISLIQRSSNSIIGGTLNLLDETVSSSIIGGSGNTLNGTRGSAIIAASGITGTDHYTLYTNNIKANIVSASTLYVGGSLVSSASTLPAGVDGNMLYNSGTTWISKEMGIRVTNGATTNFVTSAQTFSSIFGGFSNTINQSTGGDTIVGGSSGTIEGGVGKIGNSIFGSRIASITSASTSVLVGGQQNLINGLTFSPSMNAIVGGVVNTMYGSPRYSSIIGGFTNKMSGVSTMEGAIMLGGTSNSLFESDLGSMMGGTGNLMSGGTYSTIIGGAGNYSDNSLASCIIAGSANSILSSNGGSIFSSSLAFVVDESTISSIVGGNNIIISGSPTCFIAGGDTNFIYGSQHSSIVGGNNNTLIETTGSAIIAGSGITATNDYTLYTVNTDIQNIIDLKPISVLPAAKEGRMYYSGGTGLMICTGATSSDWKRVQLI